MESLLSQKGGSIGLIETFEPRHDVSYKRSDQFGPLSAWANMHRNDIWFHIESKEAKPNPYPVPERKKRKAENDNTDSWRELNTFHLNSQEMKTLRAVAPLVPIQLVETQDNKCVRVRLGDLKYLVAEKIAGKVEYKLQTFDWTRGGDLIPKYGEYSGFYMTEAVFMDSFLPNLSTIYQWVLELEEQLFINRDTSAPVAVVKSVAQLVAEKECMQLSSYNHRVEDDKESVNMTSSFSINLSESKIKMFACDELLCCIVF